MRIRLLQMHPITPLPCPSHRVFDAEVAAIFDATVNFGTSMKDKFFRARNNNDIVPRIPPRPYKHVGKEIYFDRL